MARRRSRVLWFAPLALLVVLVLAVPAFADPPPVRPVLPGDIPVVPIGLDAYREWAHWYALEIGPRMTGMSTADPAGSNLDNVAIVRRDGNVRTLFDAEGPAVMLTSRFQEDYGAPWNVSVDDKAFVLRPDDFGRTSPRAFPARAMPFPLSMNAEQTSGSHVLALPIPFNKRLTIASTTGAGNFYALFKRFPFGTPLPTWTGDEKNDDVASLLSTVSPASKLPAVRSGRQSIAAGSTQTLAELSGPAVIRRLAFTAPRGSNGATRLAALRIAIRWDGDKDPAVDVPLRFLSGVGGGVYKPDNRQLVEAFPVRAALSNNNESLTYAIFLPMPFLSSAKIEVINSTSYPMNDVSWDIAAEPLAFPQHWTGRFYANYKTFTPTPGADMELLNWEGTGKIVGTVVNFGKIGETLEGDPRFFLDESDSPQIAITGTEEWGLGGNYWRNGRQASLPFGGHPSGQNGVGEEIDGASLYRFLLADGIIFNRQARLTWEHGPSNNTGTPYRASVMWYGVKAKTAERSDSLVVGDEASRASHDYQGAVNIQAIDGAGLYAVGTPGYRQYRNSTTTPLRFTMTLDSNNVGAFLRRGLDTAVANQRAEVWIDGSFAGIWYTAGGGTAATDESRYRRFRDDEFPIHRNLTAGKSQITIEVRPSPNAESTGSAWTEFDYALYSLLALPNAPTRAIVLPAVMRP